MSGSRRCVVRGLPPEGKVDTPSVDRDDRDVSAKHPRRRFLKTAAAAAVGWNFQVVPRHVIGGPDHTPPSETFGAALIGVGGRGPGTFRALSERHGLEVRKLAECDVKWVGEADDKTRYTDYRRILEREDIDIVAIATPPHWHAVMSIDAMEAGKDVLCEKPMTRTIAEGRAVVEAEQRTGRVFQICTYGRFGQQGGRQMEQRKIMLAGMARDREIRFVRRGGFKVFQWSGPVDVEPREPPTNLDWDMYCGPSPLKPFIPSRFGGMHRGYWDYDGGGLGDMGQHYLDPITWVFGKDGTSPIEVEASAPPAHPEVAGPWGWVKLRYEDGFEIVLESDEWGEPTGLSTRGIGRDDLTDEEKQALDEMPDPEPLVDFGEAVRTRQRAGGHAEAAHRTVCLLHLANLAIRTGRKIRFDPELELALDDDQANRLVRQPMRAPWHV